MKAIAGGAIINVGLTFVLPTLPSPILLPLLGWNSADELRHGVGYRAAIARATDGQAGLTPLSSVYIIPVHNRYAPRSPQGAGLLKDDHA